MTDKSHEQIDDLFVQIRLQLLQLRQSDPEVVESLKSLMTQLEDCIESLVVDSLKLKSLEAKEKAVTSAKKKPQRKS